MQIQNSRIRKWAVIALQAALIALVPGMAVFPVSCKLTAEGIRFSGGDYVAPVLERFSVESPTELRLGFSEEVVFKGVVFSEGRDGESDSYGHSDFEQLSPALYAASGGNGCLESSVGALGDDGTQFVFVLAEEMTAGKGYELYGLVEDRAGNTLTFSLPFIGYNARVPQMIMTEIQADYQKGLKAMPEGTTRNEFIELLALSDGNLAGLELSCASDTKNDSAKYRFPAIEVKAGEIILVHMRTVGEGCISEETDDLTLAYSGFTDNKIRDLWSKNTEAVIGQKTDIVILRDLCSGKVLDAVMYRDESVSEWKYTEYARLVDDAGVYESSAIDNATVSTGITSAKTFIRVGAQELLRKAMSGETFTFPVPADSSTWAVGSASPGTL